MEISAETRDIRIEFYGMGDRFQDHLGRSCGAVSGIKAGTGLIMFAGGGFLQYNCIHGGRTDLR